MLTFNTKNSVKTFLHSKNIKNVFFILMFGTFQINLKTIKNNNQNIVQLKNGQAEIKVCACNKKYQTHSWLLKVCARVAHGLNKLKMSSVSVS